MKLYNQYRTQELNIDFIDLNTGLIYDTGERDIETGEMIAIFVPFTERELAERKIDELKAQLANTDYQAIKYAEGELSEYIYAPIREQRKQWRQQINELEIRIKNLL